MSRTEAAPDGWPLERLLAEVVGVGPKSAAEMTTAQARAAFERILDGEPHPTTLGAFWLANRWKQNTPGELAGFVDAMRNRSVRTAEPAADVLDCGANYDGKLETAILGVAAGIVSAAAGGPVVVHSAGRVPTKRGATYRDVLDALGVATALEPDASARMADETGVGFYDARRFNPLVDGLLEHRSRMGVRTFVNTVETLANPAGASAHLGSFYHLAFAHRLLDAVEASETLAFDRVLLVQGQEGYDDVRPGHSQLAELRDGAVEEIAIGAGDFGMPTDEADLQVDDVARESARLTEAVVDGGLDGPVADAVAVNAGLRIYAAGVAPSLDAGVATGRAAVDDGRAAAVLEALRGFEP